MAIGGYSIGGHWFLLGLLVTINDYFISGY